MCAHRWAEINFTKVSSLCLDRHKRVFLNEGKDSARDNLDRLACRERKVEGVRNTFLSICVVAAEREIVTGGGREGERERARARACERARERENKRERKSERERKRGGMNLSTFLLLQESFNLVTKALECYPEHGDSKELSSQLKAKFT